MSLQERISAQSKLDTDLMVQNNRIGISARKQENNNIVLPFNQVDEELLREYNQQFPTGFEFTDDNGDKKYRKYMLPQDAPNLEDIPQLNIILTDEELFEILKATRVQIAKTSLQNLHVFL